MSSFDQLPDAVLVVDANRTVTAANPAAARLTGFATGELVGSPLDDVLWPRRPNGRAFAGWHPAARLRSVRAMPEQPAVIRRADGRDVTVRVTGTYLRRDGRLDGAVLALREARETPGDAPGGIEIVSTVSHELRSPLASVKGYTSLLLHRWERLSDEDKRMMLEQVNHDADRVTRLIGELLDISRLETGRLALRRQLIDLAGLAQAVVAKVRLEYPQLEATVRFPADMPRVWADADKVEQVLTNLVENACKYASPLGITILGEVGEGEASVTVTDQGEGIPPTDLPRVFSKFFRRSEGKPTGSGLGLWISRGLVEAHGGRLLATSNLGQGSSFRFTLPVTDD